MTTNILGDMTRALDLDLPASDRMRRINRKMLLQGQARLLADAYQAGELREMLDKLKHRRPGQESPMIGGE